MRPILIVLSSSLLLSSCGPLEEVFDEIVDDINKATDQCEQELNLLFDFDSDDVAAQENNEAIMECIVDKFGDDDITLEGHADEKGTNEYNHALGHRRANNVKNALKEKGFKGKITTISYGEERLSCTDYTHYVKDHDCQKINRRVTVSK